MWPTHTVECRSATNRKGTDTHHSVDKPRKHNVQGKKPGTNGHINFNLLSCF